MEKYTEKEMLERLIKTVEKRNLTVELVSEAKDGIEIAQLKNKRIIVNTSARDTLGVIITIGHLFGHLIQFTEYKKYKHLVETVRKPKPLVLDEVFKKAFYGYELEAFRMGKGLLLEALEIKEFDTELEYQYQNYIQTDFEHFWHYITTNEKEDISYFNEMLGENYEKNKSKKIIPLIPLDPPRVVLFTDQEGIVD